MGQSSESSLCLLRVIQRDVMLRSSSSSSGQRFPFSPPGRSRWQEGVLLQGHPRPWPFAKLRTLWVPAHKVQGTKTDSAALAFYLAFSLGGARASCHLRHSVPDKEAVHVRVAPVGGFLVLHSRAGSARRQRPGSRQSRQPRLRRRSSKVSRHGVSACLSTDAIPPASASCRRGRHLQKLPGIRGAGRSGPGLGGRLPTAHRPTLPDRLQGHTLRCASGPCWFRDSGPGARGEVIKNSHDITRAKDQVQRLKTNKVD